MQFDLHLIPFYGNDIYVYIDIYIYTYNIYTHIYVKAKTIEKEGFILVCSFRGVISLWQGRCREVGQSPSWRPGNK
jgi:hypothetical protein